MAVMFTPSFAAVQELGLIGNCAHSSLVPMGNVIKKIIVGIVAALGIVALLSGIGVMWLLNNFGLSPHQVLHIFREQHADAAGIRDAGGPIKTPNGIAERASSRLAASISGLPSAARTEAVRRS
jgi:hypothetical protein